MLTEQRAIQEALEEKHLITVGKAVDYLLLGYLHHSGIVLRGLSVKITEDYALITLRLIVEGTPQVAFVGGDTLSGAFLKASKMAGSNSLQMKPDKYADTQT